MKAKDLNIEDSFVYLIGGDAYEFVKFSIKKKDKVRAVFLNYFTNTEESFDLSPEDEVLVRDDD